MLHPLSKVWALEPHSLSSWVSLSAGTPERALGVQPKQAGGRSQEHGARCQGAHHQSTPIALILDYFLNWKPALDFRKKVSSVFTTSWTQSPRHLLFFLGSLLPGQSSFLLPDAGPKCPVTPLFLGNGTNTLLSMSTGVPDLFMGMA